MTPADLASALKVPIDVRVTLDLETYFDAAYSLRKLTTEAYVRDPRWQVIGVGVKWGDRPSVWLEEGQFRAWARRVDWSRVALVCHHAQFDAFALNHHYGISPGLVTCTMAVARALGHRRVGLDVLAQAYGLGHKGKELEAAKGKRRRDFTREEWLAFGGYCRNDVELTAGLLDKMKGELPPLEWHAIDFTIRAFTEPVFGGNLGILERSLVGERARKAALLERIARTNGIPVTGDPLEAARETLSSSDKFAELLRGLEVEPPMKDGTRGPIYAFAKSDPAMQDLLEHPREDVRFLCEARLSVKSTIVETRTERLIGIAKRGRVPFYLKYCGAHTHRWSGGDKMNPQNFDRFDEDKPGSGQLRAAIEVGEDEAIVVVDSSQIEARKVGWVAGEKPLLETFKRNDEKTRRFKSELAGRLAPLGRAVDSLTKPEAEAWAATLAVEGIEDGDFYSDVGSGFFLRKISRKDKERQISKSMVLGLGFGMGFLTFATNLLKGMLGAKPVQFGETEVAKFKVDVRGFWEDLGEKMQEKLREVPTRIPLREFVIHCAVTAYFVGVYRARNPQVKKLWKSLGDVIPVMAEEKGDSKAVRMRVGPGGCLKVIRHGIVKPNGLVLHYPGLKRRGSDWVYLGAKKGGREIAKIYGGLLTENVVQSLARDVVAEQCLRVLARTRRLGVRLGTTTHDEGVFKCKAGDADEVLAIALEEFGKPPEWCPDIPLSAEGGWARSYGNAK